MAARVEVSTEDSDNFRKNLVTVLAEERIGLAVKNPNAFVKGDFATARLTLAARMEVIEANSSQVPVVPLGTVASSLPPHRYGCDHTGAQSVFLPQSL